MMSTTEPRPASAPQRTWMAREIDEIPEAAARLADQTWQQIIGSAASRCRRVDPPVVLTLARGSSDHAATYLAYVIEWLIGVPVSSARPSILSVYGRELNGCDTITLAISQSGRSEDIVAMAQSLGSGGSTVIALTNVTDCPLADAADIHIPTGAGPERAVAATKSFTNSIISGLWLAAHWSGDRTLSAALQRLPDLLKSASAAVNEGFFNALQTAGRAVILARGPALGVAGETALKLQESAGIFAVPYSAAEVLHGPSAMLRPDIPILALGGANDHGTTQALDALGRLGMNVFRSPPLVEPVHPLVDPLLEIVPIYRATEAFACTRGLNPDAPPNLKKVTVTR